MWQYIIDLDTNDLIDKLSFTYLDDVITKQEAADIINENKKKLPVGYLNHIKLNYFSSLYNCSRLAWIF